MDVRTWSTLLLLLSACATPEPTPKRLNQAAFPFPPLVEPVGLSPPVTILVDPRVQPEAGSSPEAAVSPRASPAGGASNRGPPAPPLPQRRPECEPTPTPHRGGDELHNWCADEVPLNDFRGFDVLVNSKRFDALQLGRRVLWEIKTDRFDTYSLFLQRQVVINQVTELRRERDLARACGYDFFVGVSSAAHRTALLAQDRSLNIVVMEWC